MHIRLARFIHVLQDPLLALNPPCISTWYVQSTKSHLKNCVLNRIFCQIIYPDYLKYYFICIGSWMKSVYPKPTPNLKPAFQILHNRCILIWRYIYTRWYDIYMLVLGRLEMQRYPLQLLQIIFKRCVVLVLSNPLDLANKHT